MQTLQTPYQQSRRFLKMAYSHLMAHGVRAVFYRNKDKSVFKIDGYFDPHDKQLAVYRQPTHSDTMAIFVHEYCHFLLWIRCGAYNATTGYDKIIEKWLHRQIPYSNDVKNAFKKVKQEEIQCDSMAMKLINQYRLPVVKSQFIMEANRQILRYACIEKTRKWSPSGDFFGNEKLTQMIPQKYLKSSYVDHIPERMMTLALELY